MARLRPIFLRREDRARSHFPRKSSALGGRRRQRNGRARPGRCVSDADARSDTDADTIADTGLAPTDPKEAALLATLNPGNYTALVSGVNGATGIGLIEVYDTSPVP